MSLPSTTMTGDRCSDTRRGRAALLGCAVALAALLSSGCVISKGGYRNGLIWDPIPASSSIDARATVEAECLLTQDLHQLWKALLNPDVNIVNYREAFCDGVLDDMERSRLFTRLSRGAGGDADVVLKIISTESKQDLRMTLTLTDVKSRRQVAEYQSVAAFTGVTASRGAGAQRALADLRAQMLADYHEGKGIALALVPRQEPQRGSLVSQPTSRPAPAAPRSDIDDVPAALSTKNRDDAYAVVIGIEEYRNMLPRADFAAHDAQRVSEYLTKALGYPEENVVTLINDRASQSDLAKYFEKWLPNNVEKGGSVFVYFSGHGAPNPKTADAYLVPYDGDPTFIDETGYSLKRMYAALGKLPAKEVVVALDSCFSGAGGRSVIAKGARPLVMNLQTTIALPKNIVVLSASSGDQMSSTYDEKGHGLFTYFLLKGIKGEDVVRPDGSLKIDELYEYVKPRVERTARKQYNNEQTPQLIEPKKN